MQIKVQGRIQPDQSAGILYLGFARDRPKLVNSGIPNNSDVEARIDGRLTLYGKLQLKGGTPWLGPTKRGDRRRMTELIREAGLPSDAQLPVVLTYNADFGQCSSTETSTELPRTTEYEEWLAATPDSTGNDHSMADVEQNDPGGSAEPQGGVEADKSLGDAGEHWILHVERDRIRKVHGEKAAEKVEHVAATQGPKAGFDILSLDDVSGEEIHIEVKTTRSTAFEPFFLTANELETAKSNQGSYYIYRVFGFDDEVGRGKFFVLTVAQLLQLNMTPVAFQIKV